MRPARFESSPVGAPLSRSEHSYQVYPNTRIPDTQNRLANVRAFDLGLYEIVNVGQYQLASYTQMIKTFHV